MYIPIKTYVQIGAYIFKWIVHSLRVREGESKFLTMFRYLYYKYICICVYICLAILLAQKLYNTLYELAWRSIPKCCPFTFIVHFLRFFFLSPFSSVNLFLRWCYMCTYIHKWIQCFVRLCMVKLVKESSVRLHAVQNENYYY